MNRVRIYGIRHHGPGSAKRLKAALDANPPTEILIELPHDATPALEAARDTRFEPPVALLAYGHTTAAYPLVSWSPEWVAIRWAHDHGVRVTAFDRPHGAKSETTALDAAPLDTLAEAAGFDSGEEWWDATFETRDDNAEEVFTAATTLIAAARENAPANADAEEREAWMRVLIHETLKRTTGTIAVVCGAWHAPALTTAATTEDHLTVHNTKVHEALYAWVPWTNALLTRTNHYGAGMPAPRWYEHLWNHGSGDAALADWITQITTLLRQKGIESSAAQAIDATQLTRAITALRNRTTPTITDIKEAITASVLHGNDASWREISDVLLVGNKQGFVPEEATGSPLLNDFNVTAERLKLPREGINEWLADLRKPRDQERSAFLHRLRALGVDWGTPSDVRGATGTFREQWSLVWRPAYLGELLRCTPLGFTVREASSNALRKNFASGGLSEVIRIAAQAILCDLPEVMNEAAVVADAVAVRTQDAIQLAEAATKAASIVRVGTVRDTDLSGLRDLAERMFISSAYVWLPETRSYDAKTARTATPKIKEALKAIPALPNPTRARNAWNETLVDISNDDATNPYVSAFALRETFDEHLITEQDITQQLNVRLSPTLPYDHAAEAFEGFFTEPIRLLTTAPALLATLDAWLTNIAEEDLPGAIAAFRRVFSAASPPERVALWDALFSEEADDGGGVLGPHASWDDHMKRILGLLGVSW